MRIARDKARLENWARFATSGGLIGGVVGWGLALFAGWYFLLWVAGGLVLAGGISALLAMLVRVGRLDFLFQRYPPGSTGDHVAFGAMMVCVWIVAAGALISLFIHEWPSGLTIPDGQVWGFVRGMGLVGVLLTVLLLGPHVEFRGRPRHRRFTDKVMSDEDIGKKVEDVEVLLPEEFNQSLILDQLIEIYRKKPDVAQRYWKGLLARFSSQQDIKLLRKLAEEAMARANLTITQMRAERAIMEEAYNWALTWARFANLESEASLERKGLDYKHKELDYKRKELEYKHRELDLKTLHLEPLEEQRLKVQLAEMKKRIRDLLPPIQPLVVEIVREADRPTKPREPKFSEVMRELTEEMVGVVVEASSQVDEAVDDPGLAQTIKQDIIELARQHLIEWRQEIEKRLKQESQM